MELAQHSSTHDLSLHCFFKERSADSENQNWRNTNNIHSLIHFPRNNWHIALVKLIALKCFCTVAAAITISNVFYCSVALLTDKWCLFQEFYWFAFQKCIILWHTDNGSLDPSFYCFASMIWNMYQMSPNCIYNYKKIWRWHPRQDSLPCYDTHLQNISHTQSFHVKVGLRKRYQLQWRSKGFQEYPQSQSISELLVLGRNSSRIRTLSKPILDLHYSIYVASAFRS